MKNKLIYIEDKTKASHMMNYLNKDIEINDKVYICYAVSYERFLQNKPKEIYDNDILYDIAIKNDAHLEVCFTNNMMKSLTNQLDKFCINELYIDNNINNSKIKKYIENKNLDIIVKTVE
ncbi:MAG: hypothetical protein PUI85_01490 [Eubacteriales bacterium]|nr:hypothetical protein [Eubacteriales bacterium]MDY3332936.1 hypothetical protein [Gallibacter sp.]